MVFDKQLPRCTGCGDHAPRRQYQPPSHSPLGLSLPAGLQNFPGGHNSQSLETQSLFKRKDYFTFSLKQNLLTKFTLNISLLIALAPKPYHFCLNSFF